MRESERLRERNRESEKKGEKEILQESERGREIEIKR